MRGVIIALIVVIGLFLAMLGGAFGAQGGLMLVGICGFPFAMFAFGWTARAAMAGKRFAVVPVEQPAARRAPVARDDAQAARARRIASQNTTDSQV